MVGILILVGAMTACGSSATPSRTISPSSTAAGSPSPTSASASPASVGCAAHPDYLCIVAGNGQSGNPVPGPATASPLGVSYGLAVGGAGDLYVSDRDNNVVDMVTSSGTLSVVAGTGVQGVPHPGPATASPLDHPEGLAVDTSGNLYIADSGSNVIVRMTPAGTLTIVAGSGVQGTPVPGRATASPLHDPQGVAVDSSGNLYIADQDNSVVEKVTPSGTLSIVAGIGAFGTPVPGPATASPVQSPCGVVVDSGGDLYIADGMNWVIEKVTPSGMLSVFAGNETNGIPVAGAATASPLDGPCRMAMDSAGNLYMDDMGNAVIEKVTPSAALSIVAGSGVEGTPIPGPVGASPLDYPWAVAVDSLGNLYIGCSSASGTNGTVVRVTPP